MQTQVGQSRLVYESLCDFTYYWLRIYCHGCICLDALIAKGMHCTGRLKDAWDGETATEDPSEIERTTR
jgi:hypothetical protein